MQAARRQDLAVFFPSQSTITTLSYRATRESAQPSYAARSISSPDLPQTGRRPKRLRNAHVSFPDPGRRQSPCLRYETLLHRTGRTCPSAPLEKTANRGNSMSRTPCRMNRDPPNDPRPPSLQPLDVIPTISTTTTLLTSNIEPPQIFSVDSAITVSMLDSSLCSLPCSCNPHNAEEHLVRRNHCKTIRPHHRWFRYVHPSLHTLPSPPHLAHK